MGNGFGLTTRLRGRGRGSARPLGRGRGQKVGQPLGVHHANPTLYVRLHLGRLLVAGGEQWGRVGIVKGRHWPRKRVGHQIGQHPGDWPQRGRMRQDRDHGWCLGALVHVTVDQDHAVQFFFLPLKLAPDLLKTSLDRDTSRVRPSVINTVKTKQSCLGRAASLVGIHRQTVVTRHARSLQIEGSCRFRCLTDKASPLTMKLNGFPRPRQTVFFYFMHI